MLVMSNHCNYCIFTLVAHSTVTSIANNFVDCRSNNPINSPEARNFHMQSSRIRQRLLFPSHIYSRTYRNTCSQHLEHPKLAALIIFMLEWESMCRDCYWQRHKNRQQVGLHNIISSLQYFTLKLHKIFNSLQEDFKKMIFVLLFHFTFSMYFQSLFSENLVSKYLQLLIQIVRWFHLKSIPSSPKSL